MDELKPVRCGCGGEANWDCLDGKHQVGCLDCGICTKSYDTEAEAVEAWNTAMGAKDINVPNKFADDNNVGDKERTAKVIREKKWGDWEYMCEKCFSEGWKVLLIGEPKYCPSCGCRLEWKCISI